MTWTYSGSPTPGSTDEVRFLIGDTDTTAQQLSDEEIQYLITKFGTGYVAAAKAARALYAKYARKADTTVGQVSKSFSQVADHYHELALQMDNMVATRATPSFGGVNVAEVEAANLDGSQMQPAFKRDQFDNPRAAAKVDPFDNGGGQ